jgi:putative toxin-antitoxin system antitoxin component (TIGR02293 family)
MATADRISVSYLDVLLDLLGKQFAIYMSVSSLLDLHKAVHNGIPYRSFERLREILNISQAEFAELLMISPRTVQRRKREKRFTPEESDRILRVARLFARSVMVFGDNDRALLWLRSPLPTLGGRPPWELMDTDIGVEQLEDILGRIEYGVYG